MPERSSDADALDMRRELIALIMRLLLALVIACAIVAAIGVAAREPAQAIARAFVTRFGIAGLALGTFLADGLQFPVPPQFYMFLAVASQVPKVGAFVAICAASVVAGYLDYRLAELASRWPWLAEVTRRTRALLGQAFARYGQGAAVVASLLPVPYSLLCYAAGVNRLPLWFWGALSICRIPKLLLFFWLVERGWALAAPLG